jgi:hypothetical protein
MRQLWVASFRNFIEHRAPYRYPYLENDLCVITPGESKA